MTASRALAILAYSATGTLLRYSAEAAELTGYAADQAADLADWCGALFPEGEGQRLSRAALDLVTRNQGGLPRFREFCAPFRTRSGETRTGHFTFFSTGTASWKHRLIFVSLLDRTPALALGEKASGAGSHDPAAGPGRLDAAVLNLLAIMEEVLSRLVVLSGLLVEGQAQPSHLWEQLLREALTLERMREQVQTFRDSLDAEQPCSLAPGRADACMLGLTLQKLERFWILSALQAPDSQPNQAAIRLDIARRTVRTKVQASRRAGSRAPLSRRALGRRLAPGTRVEFGLARPGAPLVASY